jgi:hypothetical protein
MSAVQLNLIQPPLKSGVGASLRTPYKHALYSGCLGKCIAASSRLSWIEDNLCIEGCAGGGVSNAFSGTSSPEILLKHISYPLAKPTRAYLIERNVASVDHLRQNMVYAEIKILHGDYRSPGIARQIGPSGKGTSAFLYIDPNHADDVELSPSLRAILPIYTLMLITLGCNANGIKRLPTERRVQWFDRLKYLLSIKLDHHDVCLVSLMRDHAQWAYLLSSPTVWRDDYDHIIGGVARKHWTKGVKKNWLSDSRAAFWKAAEYLFLKVDGSEIR